MNSSQLPCGRNWKTQPFQRYKQLWAQLEIREDVLCRAYTPNPLQDAVTVPVLPLKLNALHTIFSQVDMSQFDSVPELAEVQSPAISPIQQQEVSVSGEMADAVNCSSESGSDGILHTQHLRPQ